MHIPERFKFIAYDGDGIGRKVGRSILANDLDELRHISHLIEAGHALVQRWIKDRQGIWINGGGDEGNAAVDPAYIDELDQLRKDYEYLVGATMSMGVGDSPSEAGRALLMAKLKGKNRVVKFSHNIEKEVVKIKKRAKKGAFKSMEEHKLAEAYLKKAEEAPVEEECAYCAQTDGVDPNHCKWCHDVANDDEDGNCPYCKDMQNDPAEGAQLPEVGEEDCAYCREKDEEAKNQCPYCNESDESVGVGHENDVLAPRIGTSPDSTNETAPAGSGAEKELYDRMEMAPPEIGKPLSPDERPPIGEGVVMDTFPKTPEQEDSRFVDGDHGSSVAPAVDPEDNHSKEALHLIAEQIESEGKPDTQEVNAIDDTDMPIGSEAEGNISRPDGFAQNTPGDMGEQGPNSEAEPDAFNEEEPDFYGVLESGLDENADSIKREKTIQIVSQALTQFKACKGTLENIKMQAPDLYSASISMLKAMIEMAALLGLNGGGEMPAPQPEIGTQQAALVPEPEAKPQEETNDEWHDPFPTHPDQGGEPKPSHAPSKNNPSPPKKEDSGSPQP